MKKKNKLDILFNGNDEIVKDLARRSVLDEKERKKMFEMSKIKLEEMKNNNSSAYIEYTSGESVYGVENYGRSIIFRRILSLASCMVLIGGIAGTMFLLNKHNGNKDFNGDLNTINPVVATTDENKESSSQTTLVSTSLNETNVNSGITNSSADSTEIQTTSKEYSKTSVYEKDVVNNAALAYMADFTARYDDLCMNIEYVLDDFNKDNVPELLIICDNNVCSELYICTYDGHQYNNVTPGSKPDLRFITCYGAEISPENNIIRTSGKYCPTFFLKINSDNTVEILDKLSNWWDSETDEMGYWRNDVKITKTEYERIIAEYDNYNWNAPEYTFYADHNGYIIDNPPSLFTDINVDELIECGELPSIGDRQLCVVYDTLILETTTDNLDLFDPNIENTGGRSGEEYSSTLETISDIFPHYGQGRKFRLRVGVYDRGNDQLHNLIVADVDFATGECNILQNKYPDVVNMHF